MIWTVDDPLKWILNLTANSGQLARSQIRLPEYNFDAVLRAGSRHQAANALYFLKTTAEDHTILDKIPIVTVNEQKRGKQGFHIVTVHVDEKVLLQVVEGQKLTTSLRDEQRVHEQKHEEYYRTAAVHVG